MEIISHVGERFGRLEVIEDMEPYLYKGRMWAKVVCRCDCGNIQELNYSKLVRKEARSCGLCKYEKPLAAKKPKNYGTAICFICGKEFQQQLKGECYCEEHRHYKAQDEAILDNMNEQGLAALIEAIFDLAKQDYIGGKFGMEHYKTEASRTKAKREYEEARRFFGSRWAETLSNTDINADVIYKYLDDQVERRTLERDH